MPKPDTRHPAPDTWFEARIVYAPSTAANIGELIANIFDEIGCGGVVLEDPEVSSNIDWADDRQAMPSEHAVIGYLPCDQNYEARFAALRQKLDQLEKAEAVGIKMTTRKMATADWAENWKKFFHPQKVAERLVVCPSWRKYDPKPGELVMTIDPGMAFGTGTHPTTGLSLQLIEAYLKPGNDFLDVGTGSGILMIAAAKLGAKKLVGVDNDPEAVKVARQNLLVNGIDPECFDVHTGDLVKGLDDRFDLVTANILPKVILPLITDIPGLIKPGGIFIASGIPDTDAEQIHQALFQNRFSILEIRHENGWAALAASFYAHEQHRMDQFSLLARYLSHEMNKHLYGVRTSAELLGRPGRLAQDPEHAATIRRNIIISTDTAQEIMAAFKDFVCSPNHGKLPVSSERTDLVPLTNDVLRAFESLFEASAIILSKDLARVPATTIPAPEFKFILRQLIQNAVQAVIVSDKQSKGKKIEVYLRYQTSDNQAVLVVADNGVGMDARQKRKCTRLGFTTRPQSYGVGLTLVAYLLKKHDIKMDIESRKNHGSTFRLFFPL